MPPCWSLSACAPANSSSGGSEAGSQEPASPTEHTDTAATGDNGDQTGEGGDNAQTGDSGGDEVFDACENPDPGPVNYVQGGPVHHFESEDYEGNAFRFCEYGGRRILLNESAGWCGPCQGFAEYLAYQTGTYEATGLLEQINDDEIFLVEFLHDGWEGEDYSVAFLSEWHERYPHPKIVVAGDPGALWRQILRVSGIPHFAIIDADFNWEDNEDGAAHIWLAILAREKI